MNDSQDLIPNYITQTIPKDTYVQLSLKSIKSIMSHPPVFICDVTSVGTCGFLLAVLSLAVCHSF